MKIFLQISLGLLTVSCLNLRAVDCTMFPDDSSCKGVVSPARVDGGGGQPALDAPESVEPATTSANPDLPPASPDSSVTDPDCPMGFHKCGTECVNSSDSSHCGAACVPCPGVTGGASTCDGTKCGAECPAGQKPCMSACVPEGAACEGRCPADKNPCGGLCVEATSISACGTACVTCPVSPNGQTSCDGDKCVMVCNPGYHACGSGCAKNDSPLTCGTGCSPCSIPSGGDATCDGTKCGAKCPAGTSLCSGNCIPLGSACDGKCPAGKHDCGGNCVSDQDTASCGALCSPCSASANADATCGADKKCGFACRKGFHECNGACVDNRSVNSCGPTSCNACPAVAGATATCDGTKCVQKCGGSLVMCNGVCQECCNGDATQCRTVANKTASCSNGTCQYVDNCSPHCEGTGTAVACPGGNAVRTACGACQSCRGNGICTNNCTGATHCENNACVDNCKAGCQGNTSTTCGANGVPVVKQCNGCQTCTGSGSCVNNCSGGTHCANNACVPDCQAGCQGDTSTTCAANGTPVVKQCGACQTCRNAGVCTNDCTGDTHCDGNRCVANCKAGCQGNSAVTCSNGNAVLKDCSAGGMTCQGGACKCPAGKVEKNGGCWLPVGKDCTNDKDACLPGTICDAVGSCIWSSTEVHCFSSTDCEAKSDCATKVEHTRPCQCTGDHPEHWECRNP
jgi:hypothetical protein